RARAQHNLAAWCRTTGERRLRADGKDAVGLAYERCDLGFVPREDHAARVSPGHKCGVAQERGHDGWIALDRGSGSLARNSSSDAMRHVGRAPVMRPKMAHVLVVVSTA